ncbi:MAG TPA: nitrate- and nitrite sensing domain-containing protein, partial [Acetobacteraceae bacterium]|nr:nitrate- and nitrite sensing domain-containing protein [Acetobacteraceae bacterium]
MQGITGAEWFNAATARMDLMKQVEDRLATDLSAFASRAVGAAIRRRQTAGPDNRSPAPLRKPYPIPRNSV